MEEIASQKQKSKSKKRKVIIVLIIDFIAALLADGLSFFKIYKPDTFCHPPECLGQPVFSYYGYPFKYLTFKPSGVVFYYDKFVYNFFIYFLLILIISLTIKLIIKKFKNK